jgi:hypothetical protein
MGEVGKNDAERERVKKIVSRLHVSVILLRQAAAQFVVLVGL